MWCLCVGVCAGGCVFGALYGVGVVDCVWVVDVSIGVWGGVVVVVVVFV